MSFIRSLLEVFSIILCVAGNKDERLFLLCCFVITPILLHKSLLAVSITLPLFDLTIARCNVAGPDSGKIVKLQIH